MQTKLMYRILLLCVVSLQNVGNHRPLHLPVALPLNKFCLIIISSKLCSNIHLLKLIK